MSTRTRTMLRFLLPSIFTNVCFFLFGIIDGIFVGNGVGTNALGAVNIVWPFVMVNYGLTVLTSIGGVTITAIRFGRGDIEGANEAFLNSVFLSVIISAVTSAAGVFLTDPISRLLSSGDTYVQMVRDYLFWYSLFIVPSAFSTNLQNFCRNDGNPSLVAWTTVIGTLMNIFLDWLFVFPLHMGIMGAALATGLSQTLGLVIVLTHYIFHKGQLRLQRFKANPKLFRKITVRGYPDMVAQFSSPVIIFCMNTVLAQSYGDIGINTYAIITYVASFALAIMYGVSEGLQPLFGQSYGAKKEEDLKYYFRSGLIIAFIGSLICVLATNYLARDICHLYGADPQTTEATVTYMPQYAWGYVIAGLNALISSYLFSTKRSTASGIFNFMRSFVLDSICILGLPLLFGYWIVWYSYGISEVLVLFLGAYLIRRTEKFGLVFE